VSAWQARPEAFKEVSMRKPGDNDLASRRGDATQAKAAQLEARRLALEAAEPTRLAREEERSEVAKARDERRAERERAKQEEVERVRAEAARVQAEADAAAAALANASETALNNRVQRVIEDEAARKAERDRRYASRKAKK